MDVTSLKHNLRLRHSVAISYGPKRDVEISQYDVREIMDYLAALERVATAARLLREDYKVRINVFLDRTQQTRLAIEEADSAIAALDALGAQQGEKP